jgi:uncharacterized membrane protein
MTDQRPGRELQEHHEGWAPGQPWPAELTATPAPPVQASPRDVKGENETPGADELWAAVSYVAAVFGWLSVPLAVYLIRGRRSAFVRRHAAQAFSLTLTVTLFAVSGGIVGALLALDSPWYALYLMGPVMFVFWLVALWYLVRAARAARRGEFYQLPGWICVPTLRPTAR